MPVPSEIVVSMSQHLGKPAKPLVKVGDEVKKGQRIGEADGFIFRFISMPAQAARSNP